MGRPEEEGEEEVVSIITMIIRIMIMTRIMRIMMIKRMVVMVVWEGIANLDRKISKQS